MSEIQGVQPNVLEEEIFEVGEEAKADPQWQAAMQRGITNYDTVVCEGISPG